jgi:hypothetical protein
MKKQILAVLFLFPLFLHAQDKWGIHLSCYQNYDLNFVLRSENNRLLSGMFGGAYHFHLKRKIFFITGFEFSQFGSQNKGDYSQLSSENVNGQYVRDPTLDDEFTNIQYYFQIPLELRVQLSQRKIAPFIQGGLVHSFLLGKRFISKFAGKTTEISERTPLFDQNALGVRLSLGFNLPFSNKGSLNIAAFTYSGAQYFFRQYKYRALGINLGYFFGRS